MGFLASFHDENDETTQQEQTASEVVAVVLHVRRPPASTTKSTRLHGWKYSEQRIVMKPSPTDRIKTTCPSPPPPPPLLEQRPSSEKDTDPDDLNNRW